MPGPILFFILIIAIDLILKSVKDKQKIEEAKSRKVVEVNKEPKQSRTLGELKTILDEELQRQRGLVRRQDQTMKNKKVDVITKTKNNSTERGLKTKRTFEERNNRNVSPVSKSMELLNPKSVEDKKEELKKDVLRGVIFSEILAPPKSIQNQRRSL